MFWCLHLSCLLSILALISLHVFFVYGVDVSAWRRSRINYRFIFDFSPSTALQQTDVFLICAILMTLVMSATVTHLILRINGFSPRNVDAIPGILLLTISSSSYYYIFSSADIHRLTHLPSQHFLPPNSLLLPTCHEERHLLPILQGKFLQSQILLHLIRPSYPISRYWGYGKIECKRMGCAQVLMVDFFMADQLTSQVPLLRHMEFTACYFLTGSFRTHHYQTCTSSKLYKDLAYVISFMPYFWRALQCARRWFDEGDLIHLANLGQNAIALVAAGARLMYGRQPTSACLALVVVTSTAATAFQLYWDFVQDWGLLNPRSKNPWLRDDLVLRHKSIYYLAIVVNFVLRLVWIEAVMPINTGEVSHRVVEFVVASLEVIRRGHWNYYRLENEHLNNVGKFRAVKAVPLPFQEMDDDKEIV
ncbi:Phosphate transporter [Nymphaea thermarum]|nr:Phosphate transporter [Nymphaea thermarum]